MFSSDLAILDCNSCRFDSLSISHSASICSGVGTQYPSELAESSLGSHLCLSGLVAFGISLF